MSGTPSVQGRKQSPSRYVQHQESNTDEGDRLKIIVRSILSLVLFGAPVRPPAFEWWVAHSFLHVLDPFLPAISPNEVEVRKTKKQT
jgi:hypothetical protein